MKYLVIFYFSFIISLSAQTTEDEFLYVTYGYKEQLLKGLDNKKGYLWKPLTQYIFMTSEKGIPLVGKNNNNVGKFEFEGLYRENAATPCAIVAIYKEKEDMEKRDAVFISIPHPKSSKDIIEKAERYYAEEINFKSRVQTEYIFALGNLAMYLAALTH